MLTVHIVPGWENHGLREATKPDSRMLARAPCLNADYNRVEQASPEDPTNVAKIIAPSLPVD
jgi:hypothetical protein